MSHILRHVRHFSVVATLVTVAAAQKKPETFFKDFGLKADALEYFNRVAFDVADAFGEEIGGRIHPPSYPTYAPTYAPTYPPTTYAAPTYAPTYAPAKPTYAPPKPTYAPTYAPTHAPTYAPSHTPALPHPPCDGYAPPQELLYVDFDPSALYSPEENCKKLTKRFLKPFNNHGNTGYGKKSPACKYGKASGGPVNPKNNKGTTVQPYSPLGVTVVSRGSCSNIYFGQTPGTKLAAPEVDDYGNCRQPGYGHHRRRMDPAHHQPVKVYKTGYDYFLQCACLCEDDKPHGGYGHQPTQHGGYGHQPTQHGGYGHQPTQHGGYGHQPTQHGGYGHQPHATQHGHGHGHSTHGHGHGHGGYGTQHQSGGYGQPQHGGYAPVSYGYEEPTYGGGYAAPVTGYNDAPHAAGYHRRLQATRGRNNRRLTQIQNKHRRLKQVQQTHMRGYKQQSYRRGVANRRLSQVQRFPNTYRGGSSNRRMMAVNHRQSNIRNRQRNVQKNMQQQQRRMKAVNRNQIVRMPKNVRTGRYF